MPTLSSDLVFPPVTVASFPMDFHPYRFPFLLPSPLSPAALISVVTPPMNDTRFPRLGLLIASDECTIFSHPLVGPRSAGCHSPYLLAVESGHVKGFLYVPSGKEPGILVRLPRNCLSTYPGTFLTLFFFPQALHLLCVFI